MDRKRNVNNLKLECTKEEVAITLRNKMASSLPVVTCLRGSSLLLNESECIGVFLLARANVTEKEKSAV